MSLVVKKFIKRCLKNSLAVLHPILSTNNSIAFTLLFFLYLLTYRIGAVDRYYFTSSKYIVAVLNSGKRFIEYNRLNYLLNKFFNTALLSLVFDISSHYERDDLMDHQNNINRIDIVFNRLQGIFFFPKTSNKDIAAIFRDLTRLAKIKYNTEERFNPARKFKSNKKIIVYLSECYSQEKIELLMYLKYHDFKQYDILVHSKYYPYSLAKAIPELKFVNTLNDLKQHSYDYLIDCNGYMMKNLDIYQIGRVANVQINAFNDLLETSNPYIDAVLSYDYFTRNSKLNNSKFIAMPDKASLNLMPSQLCDLPDELPLERNGFLTFGVPSGVEKINRYSVKLWAKLLKTYPDSKIIFFHKSYSFKALRDYLKNIFETEGIDEGRIVFEFSYRHYIDVFKDVDIHLSSYPIAGGRTAMQSFAAGFYSLNMQKDDNVYSQLPGLICSAIGRTDLTTSSQDEFLNIVSKHTDAVYIKDTRKEVRNFIEHFNTHSPDFFARALESKLKEM